MGVAMPGPIPKRDSQRRRRNKPQTPTTKAKAGEVTVRQGEPPRTGRGSGRDVWIAYARQLGHQVDDDATRGAVIALVDEQPQGPAGAAWHPAAREWYESLAVSAQSSMYEPSDWATAKVLASILSKAMVLLDAGERGAGTLVERWQIGATELLTTEGARRRARVELERAADSDGGEEAAGVVSELDSYRRRRSG